MGERMRNAPVFCALLQVQHNPILSLGRYITPIQDAMRLAGYPDYRLSKVVMFRLGPSIPEPSSSALAPVLEQQDRHSFLDRSAHRAINLDSAALTYLVSNYETFDSFSADFLKIIGIVHKELSIDYAQRVGLRYLNAIVPSAANVEAGLDPYLVPGVFGLAGCLGEHQPVSQTMSETLIQESDGNVVARVTIKMGQFQPPPDVLSDGLKIDSRFTEVNGLHAMLDTDVSIADRFGFDVDVLSKKVSRLHEKARMIFDAATSAEAKEEWR